MGGVGGQGLWGGVLIGIAKVFNFGCPVIVQAALSVFRFARFQDRLCAIHSLLNIGIMEQFCSYSYIEHVVIEANVPVMPWSSEPIVTKEAYFDALDATPIESAGFGL